MLKTKDEHVAHQITRDALDNAATYILAKLARLNGSQADRLAARMEVWRRGYVLHGEADGVLYVYGVARGAVA